MMLEYGFAIRKIAAKIGCESHTAILRLKKKYEETGKVKIRNIQVGHIS
jgi:hypothetical protein